MEYVYYSTTTSNGDKILYIYDTENESSAGVRVEVIKANLKQ